MLRLPTPLVSTSWLADHLGNPDLRIIDASWHMPVAKRDAWQEFQTAHLPHAVFFDLDRHSDHNTSLPHMLPSAEAFAAAMNALGVSNDSAVVVYDSKGLFSAARLWWMLRVFGHENVAVLDGGSPKWVLENRGTEKGATEIKPTTFKATLNPALLHDKQAVITNLQSETAVVLDARGAARFSGAEADPRAGVRAGHIPKSANVHYASLLNQDDTMKPKDELEKLLAAGKDRAVISSCGSGVTACIIDLALEVIGHRDHAVYDGSWAEWGSADDTPVVN